MNDIPKIVKIEKIKDETSLHRSFYFKYEIENFVPGQFLMIWLPRIDEKPMSVSDYENGMCAITVEKKGIFTQKMFELKERDKIGIRGPYGKGFSIKKNACIIGGGCGAAPVRPLINQSKNTTVIIGAKTNDLLLFKDEFPNAVFTTDDGSFGKKGFVTDVLEELLKEKKFSIVQCCGPEIMMVNILKVCEKYDVECECSLERYMKCGFGVCGQCSCGDKLVCKDGPVFNGEILKTMKDFSNKARTKSGKKVSLEEYYACK